MRVVGRNCKENACGTGSGDQGGPSRRAHRPTSPKQAENPKPKHGSRQSTVWKPVGIRVANQKLNEKKSGIGQRVKKGIDLRVVVEFEVRAKFDTAGTNMMEETTLILTQPQTETLALTLCTHIHTHQLSEK